MSDPQGFGSFLQENWDWRAAGNFMFGGTGSSLMFMTALIWFQQNPPFTVGLVALAFVGLGLFLVWLEIGRPWRFINVFFHPQTSWMTRESIVALFLFGLAFLGVVLRVPWLVGLAGLTGLVFLYCQAQILKASKGIPSWREPAIVPLIIVTGLAEGTAIVLALAAAVATAPAWASYTLIVLLILRLLAWQRYLGNLSAQKTPPATLQILSRISAMQIGVGNALPVVLVLLALALPGLQTLLLIVTAALVALTGWHMKFTIVARASQNQGYALGKLNKGRPNMRPPVRRNNPA